MAADAHLRATVLASTRPSSYVHSVPIIPSKYQAHSPFDSTNLLVLQAPAVMLSQYIRHRRRPCAFQFRTLTLTLLALTTETTYALTLSDWQPSASHLTPACAAVYNSPIPACSPSDFSSTNGGCTQPCINALLTLNKRIFDACSGDPQNDQFLIGEFLLGR